MGIDPTRHIVLIGEMGVGKTTIGRALAGRLGLDFFDSDEAIERTTGQSGEAIAAESGVEALHRIELAVFLELSAAGSDRVIAPAASVVDSPRGRDRLEVNDAIWLTAIPEVLAERIMAGGDRRPTTPEERARLMERRRRYYEECSVMEVDTSEGGPSDTVSVIIEFLSQPRSSPGEPNAQG